MFIAYVNETDNGCDYTIACGKKLFLLDATTRDDALLEVKGMLGDELSVDPADFLSITLFDVRERVDAPLSAWCDELESLAREAGLEQTRREELAELERLREKYMVTG